MIPSHRTLLSLSLLLPASAMTAEPVQLDAVTILGSAEELGRISGSAHRVDEATLEAYSYDDINRVLNQVPGVYVREEDGYGLRPNIGLRGGSSDRSQKVTLMEDGVLITPAPYSAPAAYYFPMTRRMVGVEVFKGPSAIQYGPQTIGGAINMLSWPIPDTPEAMAELGLGSDGQRSLHLRGGTSQGPLGGSAELLHQASDGFKDLDFGGDTGFEKTELQLKGRYDIGPGRLRLRLGYADELSNETYLGLTEDDFRADPYRRYLASADDEFDWTWQGARLGWNQRIAGGTLDLVGYLHGFERAWRKFNNLAGADIRDVLANPDDAFNRVLYNTLTGARDSDPDADADDLLIGTNDREFISSGVQARMNWEFSSGANGALYHLLEIGARLHVDRIRRDHDQFNYEVSAGRLQRKDNTRAITADNTGYAEALALWLRDEILIGNWTLVPGVRVEHIETVYTDRLNRISRDNDTTEVLPGLGLSYALTPEFTLLGGVHKGFSPATPGPAADIEPEEAVNWEAGGRWHSAAYGRVELVGFYSDYSNLTAVCTFSSGCGQAQLDQQINAGQVEILGVESAWSHDLPLSGGLRLPLSLSYTYTDTEFQEGFSSANPQYGLVEPGFELPYIPRHRANAMIGVAGGPWEVNLSASYQTAMRDVAGAGPIPAGSGSDEYTVVDLAAHWDLRPDLRLSARIDNLLNREYVVARRPFGARPGIDRQFQVALRYQFGG